MAPKVLSILDAANIAQRHAEKDALPERTRKLGHLHVVLWCFVLNPHRRSPNSYGVIRDKLRMSSPVHTTQRGQVALFISSCSEAPPLFAAAPLLLPPRPLSSSPPYGVGFCELHLCFRFFKPRVPQRVLGEEKNLEVL